MIIERSLSYLFEIEIPEEQTSTLEPDHSSESATEWGNEECTELSLFAGLHKKQTEEKAKFPLQAPSKIFEEMCLRAKKELDATILFDCLSFLDRMFKGRLMAPGKLTASDIQHCIKFTDSVAKLVLLKDFSKTRSEEN